MVQFPQKSSCNDPRLKNNTGYSTSPEVIIAKYPAHVEEIKKFIKKHHYSRCCPGVWSICYLLTDKYSNKIKAVNMFGPPPYPSIASAFTVDAYHKHLAWQMRMVGQNTSIKELDWFIKFALQDLKERGFWWVLTLTDPNAWLIDGFINNKAINCKGFSGECYHRNQFLYLGKTKDTGKKGAIAGFILDNRTFLHTRQGAVTLTQSNIKDYYPNARNIRIVRAKAKDRWVYVLADSLLERSQRIALMKYRPLEWVGATQPRLFFSRLPLRVSKKLPRFAMQQTLMQTSIAINS